MKEQQIEKDINSIRQLMERSSKFISLSGLSGVMSGTFALIGFVIVYHLIFGDYKIFHYRDFTIEYEAIPQLLIIAFAVLGASVANCIWLTFRKAQKNGQSFFGPAAKFLIVNLTIPLIVGGLFILILFGRGDFAITPSVCLIFYGLALVAASHYTYGDILWLGICELVIGLLAALFPGYGLLLWASGFGVMHILYGIIMYYKYER